jgi:hypothetical protein
MRSVRRAGLLALVAMLLASGCAHRSCCPCVRGSCPGSIETWLTPVARGSLAPDISGLKDLPPLDNRWNYYALSPQDCQCLAAMHSTLGNLLDDERRALAAAAGKHRKCVDQIKMNVLAQAAAEARNQSASDALQLYYGLVEGEARVDLIMGGEKQLDGDMERVAKLRAQGLEVPFDDSEFHRQLDDLKSKRIEVELKIGQANHSLRRMLNLAADDPRSRIWPATDLKAVAQQLDPEAEVQLGLSMRPEIQALRILAYSGSEDSLEATRQLLGSVNGLLGLKAEVSLCAKLFVLCAAKRRAAEAQARRGQMAGYEARREQELAEDIRQAVLTIESRLRQIVLAEAIAQNWQKRIGNLESESTTGKASFPQIGEARLKAFDAQGELIHSIVAWKLAGVKLKELQGMLIAECGGAMPHSRPAALSPAPPSDGLQPPPPPAEVLSPGLMQPQKP